MSVTSSPDTLIRRWDHSFQTINEKFDLFNHKIKSNRHCVNLAEFDQNEFDAIFDVVSSHLEKLKALQEQVKITLADIAAGKISSYRKHEYIIINAVTCVTGILAEAGLIISYLGDEPPTRIAGLTVGLAAGAISTGSAVYNQKLNIQKLQEDRLAHISDKSVNDAKLMKKFMKRFGELIKIAKDRNDVNISNVSHSTTSIDTKITSFLTIYNVLPEAIKSDDLYAKVTSVALQSLPKDDIIRQSLDQLDPQKVNLVSEAKKPLPTNFLISNRNESEEKNDFTGERVGSPLETPKHRLAVYPTSDISRPREVLETNLENRIGIKLSQLPYLYSESGSRINLEPELGESITFHTQPIENQSTAITINPQQD